LLAARGGGDAAVPVPGEGVEVVGEVEEFVGTGEGEGAGERVVRFVGGRVERGVDVVVVATGYFYDYPFLRELEPPVVGTGERVQGLWMHVFWNADPTLSFVGVPSRIVPFVVAEVQGAVIARFLGGRLALPDLEERKRWEEEEVEKRGAGRGFHVLGYPRDAEYIDLLGGMAREADEAWERAGGERRGKEAPRWDEKQRWIREMIPRTLKVVKPMKAEERERVKRMEDVGFDFEAWKRKGEEGRGEEVEVLGEGKVDVAGWDVAE